MKKIALVSSLGLAAAAFAAPVDGIWTGAEDGFFTNANNWAAGQVPGRYLARDTDNNLVTNGEVGATVTFGDALTGNRVTTIDFSGVYSMTNLTVSATQNRYTFGTSANQEVPIENRGIFNGGASAAALVPTITCKLRVGVECDTTGYGSDFHRFRNDSSETLEIGPFAGITKKPGVAGTLGNEFGLRLYGSGSIRFKNGYTVSNPHINSYFTGTLYLDSTLSFRNFNCYNETSADYNKVRHIVVSSTGNLKNASGFYAALANNSYLPLEVSGEGVFTQGSGGNASASYNPHVKSGMFNCWDRMVISTRMALTESRPAGFENFVLGLWLTGGAGPLVLNVPEGGSSVKGMFRFTSATANAVLEIPRIGLRGTYGAHGDEDFSFCNNGTLRYTGAGETTDRCMYITNQLAQSANTAAKYPASGTLDQKGSGVWRVTSPVALDGPSSGTFTLNNGTATDGEFAGTIAGNIALVKSGTGRWKIDSAVGHTGATTVSAGTLYVTKSGSVSASSGVSIAGGAKLVFEGDETAFAQSCPAVTVTGANAEIEVGSGCTVTLAGMNVNSGTLDVKTADNTAVFKVTGMTGDAPPSLTLNGRAASFDSEGRMVKFTVPVASTVSVHGGVLPNDATAQMGIVDGGTEGNVTLTDAATVVKSLVQQATDDAVVEIGSGRSLTAAALSIDEGKADLAIGAENAAGTFIAAADKLVLNSIDADSKITVNATPNLSAATDIRKLGDGIVRFVKDFDYSKTIYFDGGELAVTPSGTSPNFTLSGNGTFAKEGEGNWIVGKNSPNFTGDYVVRGGTVQPNALDATKFFGASGDLVLTNNATLKLFGGKDGKPDYGEKRLRAADGSILEIDVKPSSTVAAKAFRRLKLDGDLVVTGSVANSSVDTYIFGYKNSQRGEVELDGHKIVKNGYGRFGLSDADVLTGGEIELPATPGWGGPGAGNLLMLSGSFTVADGERVSVATSNDVSICLSDTTAPIPFDWIIGGTSHLCTWTAGRKATNYSNWGGTVILTNANSALSLYSYNDSSRQLVVSGKITGLGSVTNILRAGRYFLAAPTNDYRGLTYFNFPNGSGSYGAVAFARSTTVPDFSKATFTYYGGACLRMSGDGGENTSWPLSEVGRFIREATFTYDAFAGLDLADTGDFEMNVSQLGTPPAADKVSGFGRYGFYPDTYTLTVNLDQDWSAPKTFFGSYTGTLRIQGAGHPLTVSKLRVSGENATSTGIVEVVNGAVVRTSEVGAGLNDNSTSWFRLGSGGTIYGISGAGSQANISLAGCTFARGIMELLPGGTAYSTIKVGSGDNSYGGAIYQTGGSLAASSGTGYLGYRANGYWDMTDGTADFSGTAQLSLACYTNVPAMIRISGGTMSFTGDKDSRVAMYGGQQLGHSHILMTGGKMKFECASKSGRAMEYPWSAPSGYDSTGVITLDGATALLSVTNTQNMFLANQTNGLAIVNLNAGALEVGDIQACASSYPGSQAYLNFNGGTLKANKDTANWATKLTRVTVGPGGATFDTAGHNAEFKQSLVAASGNGVKSVDWSYNQPVDLPFFVRIVGDGTGASAVVEYNRATKMMTGIRILSEGSGYTWAKARITSGQTTIYRNGYHTEVDCTLGAASAPGGLVKKGAGKLTLSGANNAWGGDTVVEGGLLEIGAEGALPAGAHIVLKGGGILAAAGVTMPTTLEVNLTAAQFADQKARYVLASYPNGVPAVWPTFNWTGVEPTGCWQVCAVGNTLELRYVKGTMLFFR